MNEVKERESKTYMTRKKAGEVARIPEYLPVITERTFKHALSLQEDRTAYLQPVLPEALVVNGNKIMIQGFPATEATLRGIRMTDGIGKINLPLLRILYGIILERFWEKAKNGHQYIDEIITIYYPDFARQTGRSSSISKKEIENFNENLLKFNSIIGVMGNGSRVLPVMNHMGADLDRKIIRFSSPYMTQVIKDIYGASIKRDKRGEPVLKKNKQPLFMPAYSYLIRSAITKERNHIAVEMVVVIVSTIEQAGNHIPHISARTIVRRVVQLSESLNRTARTQDKNIILKRAFSKAWILLRTQTRLTEVYKNIDLPDPDDKSFIPTISRLDMVVEFPHEGKNTEKCRKEFGELS